MTTTVREFQRNFKKMRQRARAGEKIIIRERKGASYAFQITTAPPTLAAAAQDIIGSFRSGKKDLASHPRHLAGYGGK